MTPTESPPAPPPRPSGRWALYVLAVLCVAGCLVLLPCVKKVRDGELWQQSANRLRVIGHAMDAYHAQHGRLPPAAVTGKDGRPLYSWRVELLPYLEEEMLYLAFKLDEPWDSPHNKKLVDKMPWPYRPWLDYIDPPGLTRYQVFVGPGTAFERPGLTWDDFPDGRASTILVVEAAEPVPWTKPADLAYDPDGPLPALGAGYTKPVNILCYEVGRHPGFNACFADGTPRFLRSTAEENSLRALITRNGGEKVDPSGLE